MKKKYTPFTVNVRPESNIVSIENSAGLVVITKSEALKVIHQIANGIGQRVVENPILEYDYLEDSEDIYYFLNNYGEPLTDTEFSRIEKIADDLDTIENSFNHRNKKWENLNDRALKQLNKACQKYEIRQH
jgi:hypothetical protein